MRNTLRTFVACLLILMMLFNPAVACDSCGGWGDYYSYGPVYYADYYDDCCCGSYEVVVDDCCDPCDGVVIEGAPIEVIQEGVPAAPMETVPPASAQTMPEQPAQVERPVEAPPQLPPQPAQPEATEPAPPEQPSTDLFNGTEATTPPAETPATETPAEQPAAPSNDLFNTETPAEPAAPAETPAVTPPQTPPANDDLFGTETPAETPPAPEGTSEEKAGEEPAGEEKGKTDADNIFGAVPSVLHQAGGLASSEMRLWVDNTGNFSCYGRLIRFLDGHVRILKDNGRTSTVDLARLSKGDLEFVNAQASAQQAETSKTASR